MSSALATDERTPLISSADDSRRENHRPEDVDNPRLLSDAIAHTISTVSLESLVPSDILRLDTSHTRAPYSEASALDYGYALTALLYYRSQKQQPESRLDLYSQWSQEKSSEGDVKLVERHLDVLWAQFLSQYRTDQEIDTVLWTEHRKDAFSGDLLQAAQFLQGPNPCIELLTHPLVEAAVLRRWKHGGCYHADPASLSLIRRAEILFSTPRNMHLLALTSHLTYVCLLAHYLLYPPGRVITDVDTYYDVVYPHTIALFALGLANALFVATPYNCLYLTIVAALALPFPGLPQPGDGFFDILLLAFALHVLTLHRPFVFSLLYVRNLPDSIPLAGFVHQSIVDGVVPSLLHFGLPLAAALVLLSLSLDEDFLGLTTNPFTLASSVIPAPMETRNTFLLIVLATLLGFLFSIFATTIAVSSAWASFTPRRTWDRYGTDLGRLSRSIAVSVALTYDHPNMYPPPFNLLRFAILSPFKHLLRSSPRSSRAMDKVDKYVWRFTVLPFLFVAFFISKLL